MQYLGYKQSLKLKLTPILEELQLDSFSSNSKDGLNQILKRLKTANNRKLAKECRRLVKLIQSES